LEGRAVLGLVALAVLAALFVFSSTRNSLLASATAIDGDTLRLGRQLIRLQGIDAPELEQQCQDKEGRPWPCGREAHAHLAGLLSRGLVSCAIAGNDRYGRALATCSTDLIGDVGEAMVRAGFAINFIGWRYLFSDRSAHSRVRPLARLL
jgi:endonuclease YncB( thermonuclease family)